MLHILCVIFQITMCLCVDVPIRIQETKPIAVLDKRFLSVTIDSSLIRKDFRYLDLTSPRVLFLAKGLTPVGASPEVYLRVGGTDADNVIFDPTTYVLNVTGLNLLCNFVDKLGWRLVFDLNVLRRNDGKWDPSNAMILIKYLQKKNFMLDYELGNEPDLFPRHRNLTIPPKQLAEDFKLLHSILKQETNGSSKLIGPDVATLDRYNYFEETLSNMSVDVLSAVSWHHYYSSSVSVTVQNFTDVKYLDRFLNHGLYALKIIKQGFSFTHPPVWLGETSSTYGGGNPSLGCSFASGFLWLDKLGLAAQMNISVVARQALKGGFYSLIDGSYNPNPDYWTSKVYKQLMGRRVLDITGYLQYNRKVRIYAHCVKSYSGSRYSSTSIVLMVLNLSSEKAKIRFSMKNWENLNADLYLFQPAFGKLKDRLLTLNGNLLKVDDEFPLLRPVVVAQPYVIPSLSYGFLVILDSHVHACKA